MFRQSLCFRSLLTHARTRVDTSPLLLTQAHVLAPPLATVPIVTRGGEQLSNTETVREHLWSRQRGAVHSRGGR